jgi:uncharacterized protein (TIGR03083 family)
MANEWNAMTYEGKDNILHVVRREAAQMMSLASEPGVWEQQTASEKWQVRDVVGHLVDTTEAYFVSFDAARGKGEAGDAYGLPGMAERVNEKAQAFRDLSQEEMLSRLKDDFDTFYGIMDGLTEGEWGNLIVPHFYMGPLPAFFYPAFQLMDYGVHSWDIRQGLNRAHGLAGDAADLLAPFMMVLWQATASTENAGDPFEVGIRVTSGPNAADYRVRVAKDGFAHEVASIDGLPVVFEFDPASLVLTAFGRVNAGTYRGDPAIADRFLNLFFRI